MHYTKLPTSSQVQLSPTRSMWLVVLTHNALGYSFHTCLISFCCKFLFACQRLSLFALPGHGQSKSKNCHCITLMLLLLLCVIVIVIVWSSIWLLLLLLLLDNNTLMANRAASGCCDGGKCVEACGRQQRR